MISPVHGFRGMAKARLRNCGRRRTRRKGVSFGRREVQIIMDRLSRIVGRGEFHVMG